MSSNVEKSGAPEVQGLDTPVEHAYVDEKTRDANFKQDAIDAENLEHNMGVLQALREYPMAATWAFVMSCTIIMESYCVFLMGNFVALPAFKEHFGILSPNGEMALTAEWQSALQMGGPIGAIIGVVLAGPLTSWIGYRWATIIALMFLNAFIFIIYFGNSLPIFLVSQLTAGIPWGVFIANSPAYCSEIVPIPLRAPATQMLQMFWAFGSIIVTGISYTYAEDMSSDAYRVPSALQWMFPTPLAILMFLAPESPWWLVRKGRLEEAARSIARLGSKLTPEKVNDSVAMMRRTVELEANNKEPNLIELWKGTDRYRTLIVCGVYAAQNLTGNLIANQAVVFFQSAGMGDQLAFALGLITSGLQVVMVMLSWILTTYLGRRTIYVWGSAFNVVLLVALGVAASIGDPTARPQALAQASLGLIVSVLFTLGPAPASWVIIGETSSIRLRPLTTGIGRGCYYIINIPCIYLSAWMLSVNGANLGAKCGYVWGGTGLFCTIMAYFFLPEMQHRSYREIDILFKRHVNARKWPETLVDAQDDE